MKGGPENAWWLVSIAEMEPGLGLFGISGPEAVTPRVVVVTALVVEEEKSPRLPRGGASYRRPLETRRRRDGIRHRRRKH